MFKCLIFYLGRRTWWNSWQNISKYHLQVLVKRTTILTEYPPILSGIVGCLQKPKQVKFWSVLDFFVVINRFKITPVRFKGHDCLNSFYCIPFELSLFHQQMSIAGNSAWYIVIRLWIIAKRRNICRQQLRSSFFPAFSFEKDHTVGHSQNAVAFYVF